MMKYKNDLKKSWSVIKDIINRKKTTSKLKTKFLINDKPVEDCELAATASNHCFTNIGPDLDTKIPPTKTSPNEYD